MTVSVTRMEIREESDVARAVMQAGKIAGEAGFPETEKCMIATALSELARNILKYAGQGSVAMRSLERAGRGGIEMVAEDEGPGIEDVEEALRDQFSSAGTLGLGLPGVRRLMDEFEIDTAPGRGTRITARKWL